MITPEERIKKQKREYYKINKVRILAKQKAQRAEKRRLKKEVVIYLKELTPNFSYVQINI